MKRLYTLLYILTVVVTSLAATWTADKLPQPRQRDASNFVSNPDGILSTPAVRELNTMLNDINQKTHAQVAVAVIDNFEGKDIDSFATDLFENWGLGEKGADNGILIVVAKEPRQYVVRTGRGVGSILTDLRSKQIGETKFKSAFIDGNYDQGLIGGVRAIHSTMTTPEAVEELLALSEENKEDDDPSLWDILIFYLWLCVASTAFLAIWSIVKIKRSEDLERHHRYVKLHPMSRILYGLGFVGLGMPFLVYLPVRNFLNNLRNGAHQCPNCNAEMEKLDEVHDNDHLTPAQDAEERFNSVDYDVWLCPQCGETDVYAFENQDSSLVECPNCHAKTAYYVCDRVLKAPTSQSEGLAVKEFDCLNCKKRSQRPYKLPRHSSGGGTAAAIASGVVLGAMLGGSRGGGGGGGSFGGGRTGGGGASGSW